MMTPEQRAMAVRALRAAADKIEAGSGPGFSEGIELYRRDEPGVISLDPSDLKINPEQYINHMFDEVSEDIEDAAWGVMVDVEGIRVESIASRCAKHNDSDEAYYCGVVELLAYKGPKSAPDEECHKCWEEEEYGEEEEEDEDEEGESDD